MLGSLCASHKTCLHKCNSETNTILVWAHPVGLAQGAQHHTYCVLCHRKPIKKKQICFYLLFSSFRSNGGVTSPILIKCSIYFLLMQFLLCLYNHYYVCKFAILLNMELLFSFLEFIFTLLLD